MTNTYTQLLQPGHIGSMTLRNRMVATAMGVNLAEPDGSCGERIRAFHEEHAKGGAALVIMGTAGVGWPLGSNQPGQVAVSDDRYIPGLQAVADAVHAHGAKMAMQLHFAGLVGVEDLKAGRPVWGPSIPEVAEGGDFMDGLLPGELEQTGFGKATTFDTRVMTLEDIQQLIEMFAAGAERARRAGMDAVEIHGGHGYILSSFISPVTNRRTDAYGGSLENRVRLLLEVLRAVRERVGAEFPVWCKLDSQEFGQPHGITLEDAKYTARMVEQAGADAIIVTAYHDAGQGVLHSGSHTPDVPGLNVDSAAAIKSVVSIPVIASGRIEPELADRHIAEGKFDFLAMGRKLLADPHLPRKLAEGRPQDVRPCVYCYCCISQIYVERGVKCAVNPETGFERERLIYPAERKKKVVVIGSGPGGMESARRLTLKGHQVILLEQTDRLGGTLQFAAIAYEPNGRLLSWLKREIETLGVDVRLNTPATPELLRQLGPDEVVVATGAIRSMPAIPGAERDNVFSGDDLRKLILGGDLSSLKRKTGWVARLASKAGALTGVTRNIDLIREATRTWMPLGERIVIIGGELVGLELAEFLALRGRKVTVIDDTPRFGAGLYIVRRLRVLHELRHLGVSMLPAMRDTTIGEGEVRYLDGDGQARAVAADHVIVAKGASGDLHLAEQLRAAGFTVHTAGDCNGVGYIEGAMEGAAEVAVRI
ncbi:MAG: FAD-dependent oxidoreductase [Pseudomonas sp.]